MEMKEKILVNQIQEGVSVGDSKLATSCGMRLGKLAEPRKETWGENLDANASP
jgi:hypothetical protein